MKMKLPYFFIPLLFIACSKENNNGVQTFADAKPEEQKKENIVNYTDSLIPLNDLGSNLYKDRVGGLYPNGLNQPAGQYAKDLSEAAQKIVPRDKAGNPSSTGDVVFISLGASTGGKNMTALIEKSRNNPLVNSKLRLLNGNQPAQQAPLSYIMNGSSAYWDHVMKILRIHRYSANQVQVVYLETDDGIINSFPGRPNLIKTEIENCMRTMKTKFANLKILYVLGRPRTFSTNSSWNTEPAPYYFGWACKWAIEDQINGVSGTEYKGTNAVAPMITWGFYQWADTSPRKTDNFYWSKSFSSDGLHANAVGQDTLSTRFQKFLLTDKYAKVWYAAP